MKIIDSKSRLKKKFKNKLDGFVKKHFPQVYPGLEVVFVGDSTMRKYNAVFTGQRHITDVLSFDIDGTFIVIVCRDIARKNAIYFNAGFYDELALYVFHGILHLLGYDHKIENIKNNMRLRQEELMEKWKDFYYS